MKLKEIFKKNKVFLDLSKKNENKPKEKVQIKLNKKIVGITFGVLTLIALALSMLNNYLEENFNREQVTIPYISASMPITRKSKDEYNEEGLVKVTALAQKMVDDNPLEGYVSKNGFLYDFYNDEYVTIEYLEEFYDTDLSAFDDIMLMYLNIDDYTSESQGENPNESSSKKVYGIYKVSDDEYIVSDSNAVLTTINEEQFNQILEYNNSIYGTIIRPKTVEEIPIELYDAIKQDLGETPEIVYLAYNSQYAYLVGSADNNMDLKEIAYKKDENGNYVKLVDGLEEMPDKASYLNRIEPQFALEMIPKYNLYYEKSALVTDYEPIVQMLYKDAVLNQDDIITYIISTQDFCYVETETKNILVWKNKAEDVWEVTELTSFEEGEEIIEANSTVDNPPYYIVKQVK